MRAIPAKWRTNLEQTDGKQLEMELLENEESHTQSESIKGNTPRMLRRKQADRVRCDEWLYEERIKGQGISFYASQKCGE